MIAAAVLALMACGSPSGWAESQKQADALCSSFLRGLPPRGIARTYRLDLTKMDADIRLRLRLAASLKRVAAPSEKVSAIRRYSRLLESMSALEHAAEDQLRRTHVPIMSRSVGVRLEAEIKTARQIAIKLGLRTCADAAAG